MKYLIKGGHVISPENGLDQKMDILIEDGKVARLEGEIKEIPEDAETINGENKWVVPGLIDLHVHFREPGQTYKEDIRTGLRAAAAGGFTTVCCMPNTDPVLDTRPLIEYVDGQGTKEKSTNLLVVSAISKGLLGKEMVDMEDIMDTPSLCQELCGRGIAAVSDDGKSVEDDGLMLKAMEKAANLKVPVFSHAEEEVAMVRRDLALLEESGGHLHFCHISRAEAVDHIRKAKAKGLKVTAETAPHYFTLTKDFLQGTGGRGKVNPPLSTEEDRIKIIEALMDGTIDAIATDHAPHSYEEKEGSFDESNFGFVGLETAFALGYTHLVLKGKLSPDEYIRKMSTGPAQILGLDRGIIEVGKTADIAIFDIDTEYEIKPEDFYTKGRSTPFIGMKVKGKNLITFVGGRLVYNDGFINTEN